MNKQSLSRDQIIALAQKAGFIFHNEKSKTIMHTVPLEYSEKYFERFAMLIAECSSMDFIGTGSN